MARILVVDDETGIRELLSEILGDEGHDVLLAEHAEAARGIRNAGRPDLVLLDIWMPDTDGISLLKEWAAGGQLNMPVIMMSGHGTIDSAVEATRIGALDFLEKPISLSKLLGAVKRGLQHSTLKVAGHASLASFPRSGVLRELRRKLEQVANRSRHLLLRSRAGSIAELAARTLQAPGRSWIDLASLTMPLSLDQMEHGRGGVLFAAELGALSRPQQKNLAFALDRLDRYDLKLVLATSRSIDELLADGWEEGLLRRIFEISLPLPSLAELKDEIPDIATQVLQHLIESGELPSRRFSTGALNVLRNQPWNAGYAELLSAVRSLALAALDGEIGLEDAQKLLGRSPGVNGNLSLDQPLREAREAFERIYFEYHLQIEGGNMTRLAEKSGLERTHLYRKLKQLGLPVGRRSESPAE